jgi:acetyl/propionyl-CoA carboxylase alpha subunit
MICHDDETKKKKMFWSLDEKKKLCIFNKKNSRQSYLVMDAIIDAARRTGADAVHPGYGFLSENSKFVARLDTEGIAFVGPQRGAIEAMGDKIESKRVANTAGVSTIPGFVGECRDEAHLLEIANEIGYPVMIKASAGGGGKGMRVAHSDAEAIEGYHLSMDEAEKAFGDKRMLVEKFIRHPRHIEIQVLGDKRGNLIYLPERECSIQRRNQKVMEEAPSPFLDPATRRAMGEEAVALARAVGYDSAGTCEMMVDADKNFYFLEMNTRLQVEHPITEYVTGVDLVEQMLRAAAGQEITVKQDDVREPKGWAMECRVYAEDPYRDYLPSIGALRDYIEPMQGVPSVRCDSGVTEGSEISMFYDPMISKLVTYGEDRAEAMQTMRDALDEYVITGVRHNVALCRAVLDNEQFIAGDTHTDFLPLTYPDGFKGRTMLSADWSKLARVSAALRYAQDHRGAADIADEEAELFGGADAGAAEGALGGGSGGDAAAAALHASDVPTVAYAVTLPAEAGTVWVTVRSTGHGGFLTSVSRAAAGDAEAEAKAGAKAEAKAKEAAAAASASSLADADWVVPAEGVVALDLEHVAGPLHSAVFASPSEDGGWREEAMQVLSRTPNAFEVQLLGEIHAVRVHTELEHSLAHHQVWERKVDLSKAVPSPMPGAVIEIEVKPGDEVFPGQALCVLEAMKMMNVIKAETRAIVKEVRVVAGEHVAVDDILITFE